MNVKTWAPLAIALVLGGIAAKLGHDLLAQRSAAAKPTAANYSRVVVAKGNVAAGAALKPADLVANSVAAGAVPPGSFADPGPLVNRVITMPLIKGQPILENMLAPEGSGKGLTAIVPDGMRAVTLEVNEVSGVAGLLATGCHVDIVTTLAGEGGSMISRTVARNLPIVAVGRRMSEPGKDDGSEQAQAPARTVTLLVTPRQAELIDLAAHSGMPRLVLRGSRDSNSDLEDDSDGVTLAQLRGARPDTRGAFARIFSSVLDPMPQPAGPTTRPSEAMGQFRQVMVIRNTREQPAQVEVERDPARLQRTDFANTDAGDAIRPPR